MPASQEYKAVPAGFSPHKTLQPTLAQDEIYLVGLSRGGNIKQHARGFNRDIKSSSCFYSSKSGDRYCQVSSGPWKPHIYLQSSQAAFP